MSQWCWFQKVKVVKYGFWKIVWILKPINSIFFPYKSGGQQIGFFTDFFAKLNFVPTAHPMSTGDQPLIEVPQKIYPSANGSSVIFGVWLTTKNLV